MKFVLNYFAFTFAILAITFTTAPKGWAQQNQPSIDPQTANLPEINGVHHLPPEGSSTKNGQSFNAPPLPNFAGEHSTQGPASIHKESQTACLSCDSHSPVVTADHLFPEVKNLNFFGIDRHSCCDEWEGLCSCKSVKFGCPCGGPRPKKGYFGIHWLKNKSGAEDCDYCNGGCCKHGLGKGGCNGGCKDNNCLREEKPRPTTIFGRPIEN